MEVIPVRVAGDIVAGSRLDGIILGALAESRVELAGADVVVIAQKIVSKAEGRVVDLDSVKPSQRARKLALQLRKDPRIVELILQESKEVVKIQNGIIITETRHGLVCANSGVDQSNLAGRDSAVLLPKDPDASAKKLHALFLKKTGKDVAVIITDTFGRPFREGQVNVAIGVAGLRPIKSYIGKKDMFGRKLHVTEIAVADEIASAAELVMNKSDGVPVAIVRGLKFDKDDRASAKPLVRPKKNDLFRHPKKG
ncbi:coenzyme F420-0:L-glutamate ligase [Nitrososphaera sp.]|uniref:coenzyme F420-0:L-glutamate ligase n=1 Tax=Nitrososphaera sp. TaxID=1971748 RepID=UPI001851BA0F|nr:coenzyme F420-0:L-glutamate ligase [Nitrososphaera sp.]NWG37089.1 coenzyme F420-0:L-glutamate ligase [Nitrososphaera sp.]